MKAVYLHNFRGFSDTIIPIDRVNFLVGENSTGKSSFLSIINIISDPNFFWFDPTLNNSNIDLGNFEDMVSVESKNRKEFVIGFLLEHPKDDDAKRTEYAYLIVTYKKSRDKPKPILVSYSENNSAITVKISERQISYREQKLDISLSPIEVFEEKIFKHQNDKIGFSRLKENSATPTKYKDKPFFIIRELIKNQSKGLQNKDKNFTYTIRTGSKVVWLAPIREKPERIYDNIKPNFSPEGIHIPHLLNEVLNRKDKSGMNLRKSLSEFGKDSGLFKQITSKRFGRSEASPFEIDITLANTPIKITNVGYGVSQILPVIVDHLLERNAVLFVFNNPKYIYTPEPKQHLENSFLT